LDTDSTTIAIQADGAAASSITGTTISTAVPVFTLGANAKLDIAANNTLTAKDVTVDTTAGAIGLFASTGVLALDANADGGTNNVATLKLNGDTTKIASGATTGTDGAATGAGQSVSSSPANDINIATAYNATDGGAGSGSKVSAFASSGGSGKSSTTATLTVSSGVVSIAGGSSNSVLSAASAIVVSTN
jgi:hypothetical protein